MICLGKLKGDSKKEPHGDYRTPFGAGGTFKKVEEYISLL